MLLAGGNTVGISTLQPGAPQDALASTAGHPIPELAKDEPTRSERSGLGCRKHHKSEKGVRRRAIACGSELDFVGEQKILLWRRVPATQWERQDNPCFSRDPS